MAISAGSGVTVDSGVENGDTSVQVCSTCMAVLKITLVHVVDGPHTRSSSCPWILSVACLLPIAMV